MTCRFETVIENCTTNEPDTYINSMFVCFLIFYAEIKGYRVLIEFLRCSIQIHLGGSEEAAENELI